MFDRVLNTPLLCSYQIIAVVKMFHIIIFNNYMQETNWLIIINRRVFFFSLFKPFLLLSFLPTVIVATANKKEIIWVGNTVSLIRTLSIFSFFECLIFDSAHSFVCFLFWSYFVFYIENYSGHVFRLQIFLFVFSLPVELTKTW